MITLSPKLIQLGLPHQPYEAVLFDMDGTLLDSERLWRQAETAFLAHYGITLTPEQQAQFLGAELETVMLFLKETYNLKPSTTLLGRDLEARVKRLLPQVTPMPEAPAYIASLQEQQVKQAVVTNSSKDVMDLCLKEQSWLKSVTTRLCADDVLYGKPAPDLYLLAAQRLGVPSERCLVFEDSPTGAQAAVRAHMSCIGIGTGAHAQALAAFTPYIISDFGVLL